MGKYKNLMQGVEEITLPGAFNAEWQEFLDDCEEVFNDLRFELVKSNRPNTFIICCRPELDAGATTSLALIQIVSDNMLLFRTVDAEDWSKVDDVATFSSFLGALVAKKSQNGRLLELLQTLSHRPKYEGVFVVGDPYEINQDSLRVFLSETQCRELLKEINENTRLCVDLTGHEYEVKNVEINDDYSYPITRKNYDGRIRYKYFTFQGFLFEPSLQPFCQNIDGLLSFKLKYKRNMRM